MSVWLCIPSARPPEEADLVLRYWRAMGYKIALYCDIGKPLPAIADRIVVQQYQGYAHAVNLLVAGVLANDPECQWVVSGGDDILPDPLETAEEVAGECSAHFVGTFGVMQPTADRWGEDAMGRAMWPDAPAYIDRVCGSPWLGREFCQRVNGGLGPIWPEYFHMFEDEELQNVATKLGVLWQRRDLTHYHRHWMRSCDEDSYKMPAFLTKASSPEHWKEASELFERRKAAGFPGHEVKP